MVTVVDTLRTDRSAERELVAERLGLELGDDGDSAVDSVSPELAAIVVLCVLAVAVVAGWLTIRGRRRAA